MSVDRRRGAEFKMKKILVVQPLRAEALRLFEERPDVRFEVITDFSPDNIVRHIGDADAMTIRDAPLPVQVLQNAPKLKVVSRHGVGFDNIPVDYCTSRGLPVTVVGSVNAVSVAEQTMFLLLAAAKHGVALDAATRKGDFAARSRLIGLELRGRTLLIVGYGRIGHEMAARARAFDMKILVHDPNAKREPDVEFAETLDDGLARADVLSVHVPLGPNTRNLIGARELAALPERAIVLNTARGGILDEKALVAALDSGHVWAAGLDTFETEPLPADSALARHKRVVLSPHSAALTEESLIAMGVMTARNALAALDGQLDPALVVNSSALKGLSHAAQ